jgi:hypothetical protein
MSDIIRNYRRQIGEQIAEQNRLYSLKKDVEAKAKLAASIQTIKRTKSLDQQITELMATLPPQLQDRPWSMAELVQRLTGKYRDRPHAQNVGEALRRLGWRRERRWGSGYCGARIWLPAFSSKTTLD